MRQRLTKSRYLPSEPNIKALDENIAQLEQALKPVREKVLENPDNKIGAVEAKNPVTWKNSDLNPTVQKLSSLAASRRISLPPEFYLGFSRYIKSNPSENATQLLGKQLYGLDLLVTTLINAGDGGNIQALRSVRRTFDEDAGGGMALGTGSESNETVRGTVTTPPNGYYRVYPFEVEFVGTPVGLRKFLNALYQTPVLFIVRSVQVANTKLDAPKLAELSRTVDNRNTSGGKGGRDFIFGAEQLVVRVRVDMIEWLGQKGAEAAKSAGKPPGRPAAK